MKKIILFSLCFLAISINSWGTTDKKKHQKKQTKSTAQAILTPQDSLSFATGMAATNGLLPFLQHEYGVDEAHMNEFLTAFQEALEQVDTPEFKARHAGQAIARMVKSRILPQTTEAFKGTPEEINTKIFEQGFMAGIQNDTTIYTVNQASELFRERATAAKEAKEKAYKDANTAWLKNNSTQPGVKTTQSGLQYKIITAGTGEVPQKEDKVTVKYEGKTIDGKIFDSSYQRNPQTTSFRCDQVIKGWTEALSMMPVGSKWELYIPQELAYGARQAGQIQPYSTLIFTVELIGVEKTTKPESKK